MTTSPATAPTVDVDPGQLFADPYPTYAELQTRRSRRVRAGHEPPPGHALPRRGHRQPGVGDVLRPRGERAREPGRRQHPDVVRRRAGPPAPTARDGCARSGPMSCGSTGSRSSAPTPPSSSTSWPAAAGHADLFADFATPLAAMNLAAFLGFDGVPPEQLISWCKGIIDSGGNVMNDPEVWERGFAARAGVIEAVDAAVARVRATPDPSMISSMVNTDDPMSAEQMYSNIMISIGGGLNEPRDVLLTAVYGLLTNPGQLADVKADPTLWRKAFEESCRWVAPIGMFIREVARPVELAGVTPAARRQDHRGHRVGQPGRGRLRAAGRLRSASQGSSSTWPSAAGGRTTASARGRPAPRSVVSRSRRCSSDSPACGWTRRAR